MTTPNEPKAAELLREVVARASAVHDLWRNWIVLSRGPAHEPNCMAAFDTLKSALTAAREYLDKAGKGDSSQRPNREAPQTEAPSSDRRTVADRSFPAASLLATDPTFRQCCSPGSEYRAARRAVAVLCKADEPAFLRYAVGLDDRTAILFGIAADGTTHAISDKVVVHAGLDPTPEAPRSTEAVEAARPDERVCGYVACGKPARVGDWVCQSHHEWLRADNSRSRPARSMATVEHVMQRLREELSPSAVIQEWVEKTLREVLK